MAQRLHQFDIAHLRGLLLQRRGIAQRGAQLADIPAFDDRETILQGAALTHALQQFARSECRLKGILTHLQLAGGPGLAGQHAPLQVSALRHTLCAQLAQHGGEGIAAGDFHRRVGTDTRQRCIGKALVALPEPERRADPQDQQQGEGDGDESATALETRRHAILRG